MAPHSSTLAWKIPWMEEPGRLQSMGSLRVGHDWATSLSLFTFMHWRRKWQPTTVFLPGESQGRGSLVGCRLWGHTELDTTSDLAAAAAIMSDVEHFFMCLLAICMSSLKKCLFRSFSHFCLSCLFFWYWVAWVACIFSKLILCQLFICYYFLPFWELSFYLTYSFLCCAKVFKFNQVPLVYYCFYFHYSRRWVIEDLAFLCHWVFCLCFPLRVL